MEITGEVLLIKFKNTDIIDSLQSGCIYMNSIKKFREIENDGDDKVGDSIDGLLHIHNGYLIIEEDELKVHKLNDTGLQTRYSNDYCYCFFGMDNTNFREQFSEEQKQKLSEMGDTALIILNYSELMNRIKKVTDEKGYEVYAGFVKYYNPEIDSFSINNLMQKDGLKMFSMYKRDKYKYQQEFRIVVHAPNETADHIELNIGDISDISKKMSANTVLASQIVPCNQ